MSGTLLSNDTQLKEPKNKHVIFFPYKKVLKRKVSLKSVRVANWTYIRILCWQKWEEKRGKFYGAVNAKAKHVPNRLHL